MEITSHGLASYITFNRDFFASNDYKTVTTLGDQLNSLLEEGAYVQRGERKKAVTEFKDALTLDASTDISVTGSYIFSITNSGTGNSFVVNDQASDTTPFVEERRNASRCIDSLILTAMREYTTDC